MEAGAFTAQGGIGNLPQRPRPEAHRLEREYIWGPGDSFAGVDELFVLFDREREPWLVLQDASGDVAALCGRTSISQPAYVAAQWTWDAYGNVFSADHLFDHPFMSIGHKGLFVERLDVGVADASVPGAQYADTPRIVPFGHLIYHNRNRTYNPQQGRFLQLDMNASGVALMEAAAFNGRGMGALAVAFDMQTRYGDGPNLYQYLGSSPWQRFDPMGLFFGDAMSAGVDGYGSDRGIADPFDMVDEYIAEDAGSKAAWLENLYGNAEAGLGYLSQAIQLLPGIGESVSLYNIASGQGSFWDYLGVIPVVGRAGKLVNKLLASRLGSLAKYNRGMRLVKGCGCFAANTVVWTERGLVEISEIVPGDYVVATDETDDTVALRMVTTVQARELDAMLMRVHLSSGEVLRTTEDHPFYVEGAWVRADQIKPGQRVTSASGEICVVGVQHTSEYAVVYNLEVDGLQNYRVGLDGILVHNGICKEIRELYERQVKNIPSLALSRGGPTMENARWAYDTRNTIRTQTRERMRSFGGELAKIADDLDVLDPVKPWEFYFNKYKGVAADIIDGAGRPNPAVMKRIEELERRAGGQ